MAAVDVRSTTDGWEETATSAITLNYHEGANYFQRFGYYVSYGNCSGIYLFPPGFLRNATVSSASFSLTRYIGRAFSTSTRIYGILEAPVSLPTAGNWATRWDARTKTTAFTNWTFPSGGGTVTSTSPDISSIIQELAAQAAWKSTMNVGIFLKDLSVSGDTTQYTYGSGQATTTYRPRLQVTYTGGVPDRSSSPMPLQNYTA